MNWMLGQFKTYFESLFQSWNRFWFTPSDPATLGLIRLFAGSMIFYTHLVWTLRLVDFFGSGGLHPASQSDFFNAQSSFAWSYLYLIENTTLLWAVHIVGLLILAMFAAGCFTRITSILTFLIVVSYANRASGMLFGLDQINGMLAAYLMIGPSGAAFSVDAWFKRKKELQQTQNPKSTSATLSIRLIQIHMCLTYFFAAIGKLLGESWWNGEAIWGAVANAEYQSIDLTWLANYPEVINVMTHVTLFWELSYVALVWPKLTRPFVLALAIPLHLGIAFGLGMITFGLVMLIGNLAFVSPCLIRGLAKLRVREKA